MMYWQLVPTIPSALRNMHEDWEQHNNDYSCTHTIKVTVLSVKPIKSTSVQKSN